MEGSPTKLRWRRAFRRCLRMLLDILIFLLGGPPDPPSRQLPLGFVRHWY